MHMFRTEDIQDIFTFAWLKLAKIKWGIFCYSSLPIAPICNIVPAWHTFALSILHLTWASAFRLSPCLTSPRKPFLASQAVQKFPPLKPHRGPAYLYRCAYHITLNLSEWLYSMLNHKILRYAEVLLRSAQCNWVGNTAGTVGRKSCVQFLIHWVCHSGRIFRWRVQGELFGKLAGGNSDLGIGEGQARWYVNFSDFLLEAAL